MGLVVGGARIGWLLVVFKEEQNLSLSSIPFLLWSDGGEMVGMEGNLPRSKEEKLRFKDLFPPHPSFSSSRV